MSNVSAELHAYYASRAPYYDAVYLKPERAKDIAFLSEHLPRCIRQPRSRSPGCGRTPTG